jgi:CDP-diacylglycerol---serine O-phosphatidyltransferase
MVTFGALPGYIMFEMIAVTKGLHFVDISQWSTTDLLQCSVALLIPVGAALRLGTFNLDLTKRDHFLGLPVPAMTIMVVAVPIVLEAHYSLNFYVKISDSFIDTIGAARRWDPSDYVVVKLMYQPLFYQISSAILAAMMVIRIPMLSLKFKGLSWSKNKWRYGIFIWLAICYIIFLVPYTDIFILDFGLIDFLILPIFMFGYFVLSWIYAIFGASKSDSKLHEIQS